MKITEEITEQHKEQRDLRKNIQNNDEQENVLIHNLTMRMDELKESFQKEVSF